MHKETKPNLVVISLIIATFLTAIEGTIVSTAMPKIVQDLGGTHLYTWVISIYLLATVISSPIIGKFVDLYGRKSMFQITIIIFLIGSTLSGLSQSMEQLILFRLIQGIGSGGLVSISMTIIGDIFTLEQRARIQGWISSVWGISGILGPLVGGFIVDTISWHWIFFMNLPFGIASIILLQKALHEKITKKKQTIDYPGIVTFAISMSAFLYGLNLLKEAQRMTGSIVVSLIVTVVFIGLFLSIEAKSREPMLTLSLFKNRFITISYLASFTIAFILIAVTYYIPLWVQGVNHQSATLSGLALFPLSLTWIFGAFITNRLIKKTSIANISILGMATLIIGTIGLVFLNEDTSVLWMMIASGILGIGFGLTNTLFTVVVQSAVSWNRRGSAMGALSLMRGLGQAIGISVSGLWLTENLTGNELATSLHAVFWILVGCAIFSLVLSFLLIGKKLEQPSNE